MSTCQEFYKRAAEVEQVKTELTALNPINQKRKWIERGALSENVNQKKSAPAPPKSRPVGSVEPFGKYGRINYTSPEC